MPKKTESVSEGEKDPNFQASSDDLNPVVERNTDDLQNDQAINAISGSTSYRLPRDIKTFYSFQFNISVDPSLSKNKSPALRENGGHKEHVRKHKNDNKSRKNDIVTDSSTNIQSTSYDQVQSVEEDELTKQEDNDYGEQTSNKQSAQHPDMTGDGDIAQHSNSNIQQGEYSLRPQNTDRETSEKSDRLMAAVAFISSSFADFRALKICGGRKQCSLGEHPESEIEIKDLTGMTDYFNSHSYDCSADANGLSSLLKRPGSNGQLAEWLNAVPRALGETDQSEPPLEDDKIVRALQTREVDVDPNCTTIVQSDAESVQRYGISQSEHESSKMENETAVSGHSSIQNDRFNCSDTAVASQSDIALCSASDSDLAACHSNTLCCSSSDSDITASHSETQGCSSGDRNVAANQLTIQHRTLQCPGKTDAACPTDMRGFIDLELGENCPLQLSGETQAVRPAETRPGASQFRRETTVSTQTHPRRVFSVSRNETVDSVPSDAQFDDPNTLTRQTFHFLSETSNHVSNRSDSVPGVNPSEHRSPDYEQETITASNPFYFQTEHLHMQIRQELFNDNVAFNVNTTPVVSQHSPLEFSLSYADLAQEVHPTVQINENQAADRAPASAPQPRRIFRWRQRFAITHDLSDPVSWDEGTVDLSRGTGNVVPRVHRIRGATRLQLRTDHLTLIPQTGDRQHFDLRRHYCINRLLDMSIQSISEHDLYRIFFENSVLSGRDMGISERCLVCRIGPPNCILFLCGHGPCTCETCAVGLVVRSQACPVCGAIVEDFRPVGRIVPSGIPEIED